MLSAVIYLVASFASGVSLRLWAPNHDFSAITTSQFANFFPNNAVSVLPEPEILPVVHVTYITTKTIFLRSLSTCTSAIVAEVPGSFNFLPLLGPLLLLSAIGIASMAYRLRNVRTQLLHRIKRHEATVDWADFTQGALRDEKKMGDQLKKTNSELQSDLADCKARFLQFLKNLDAAVKSADSSKATATELERSNTRLLQRVAQVDGKFAQLRVYVAGLKSENARLTAATTPLPEATADLLLDLITDDDATEQAVDTVVEDCVEERGDEHVKKTRTQKRNAHQRATNRKKKAAAEAAEAEAKQAEQAEQ